jgi:hypothetical protein
MEEKERLLLEVIRQAGSPVKPAKLAKLTKMDPKELLNVAMSLRRKGVLVFSEGCSCGLAEQNGYSSP